MNRPCMTALGCLVMFLIATLSPLTLAQDDAKEAALKDLTFEDVHIVPLPKGEYGYRGMPGSMIQLKNGNLLIAYSRMDENGHDVGAIASRTSTDGGKTWSDESVLIPAPKVRSGDLYCHPTFLRLANGQILLSYIYGSGATPLFGHNYYRRSDDDAASWGDQLIVTPNKGYHIMHNDKLLQLSSGRILAPIETQHNDNGNDHAGYISYVFYSDDNGYSWRSSENTVNLLPVEAQEPHVVELKDGRVMMLMRTYSGSVARAYSEDKGQTWSKGEMVSDLPLPRNSSALNVKRIPATGDLLLLRAKGSGPNKPSIRTPFVSVISRDDGQSWTSERVIAGDPDDDYGYPSLLFIDNIALISYHQRDGLHVARIGIGWFYAE